MQVAVASRPLEDLHCGDQAGWWIDDSKVVLCMIDGLGHGRAAEEVALAALKVVEQHHRRSLAVIFARCGYALRHTRGVAMGMAVAEKGTLSFAGIGNTSCLVAGEDTTLLLSDSGIVGSRYERIRIRTVPLKRGGLVIMYTDGIKGPIDLSRCGAAQRADVQGLAETILRDKHRSRDDAAVLVFRNDG